MGCHNAVALYCSSYNIIFTHTKAFVATAAISFCTAATNAVGLLASAYELVTEMCLNSINTHPSLFKYKLNQ